MAKVEVDRHLCFWASALAVGIVFFTVPQVAHIWRQANPDGMGAWYVPYVMFVAAVLTFFLGSTMVVLRPFPVRRLQLWLRVEARRRPAFGVATWPVWGPPEIASRLLPRLREALWGENRGARCTRTAVVLLVFAVTILAFGAAPDGSRMFPLAGVMCRNIGFVGLIMGIWLLFPSSTRSELHLGPAVGRFISWLVATNLMGELVWYLAATQRLGFSYRMYSIWAFCQFLTTGVIAALLVDRLHLTVKFPVRPVAIAALVVYALTLGGASVVDREEVRRHMTAEHRARFKAPAELDWRRELLARVEAVPERDGPAVFVAASGGGSRAAVFTALVLELLVRTELDRPDPGTAPRAPQGGQSRSARSFADNIVLISSVSGGSLATANYVAARVRKEECITVKPTRNFTFDELRVMCIEALEKDISGLPSEGTIGGHELNAPMWSDKPDECLGAWQELVNELEEDVEFLNATYRALSRSVRTFADELARDAVGLRGIYRGATGIIKEVSRELGNVPARPNAVSLGPRTLSKALAKADRAVAMMAARQALWKVKQDGADQRGDPCAGDEFNWVMFSRSLDRMCTDFMAPLMRGVLSVALTRGDALTRFWTESFEWSGISSRRGFPVNQAWTYPPAVPLVIYNATDVAKGRRVAIGFPPVPANLWAASADDGQPERLRPVTLDAIDPELDVSLARAVRMSSNFPWGFPVQEIQGSPSRETPTDAGRVLTGSFVQEIRGSPPPESRTDAGGPVTGSPVQEKRDASPVRVRILDGGVVDNTGIDTLCHVLQSLEAEARVAATKGEDSTAAKILAALRTRGVLILEIDSGAKPRERPRTGLAAPLIEPIDALGNAAYSQAERMRHYYIREIKRIVDGAPAEAGKPRRAIHLPLSCNDMSSDGETPSDDVMTAWGLGPRDKAYVLARFFSQLGVWNRGAREFRRAVRGGESDRQAPDQKSIYDQAEENRRMDMRVQQAPRSK